MAATNSDKLAPEPQGNLERGAYYNSTPSTINGVSTTGGPSVLSVSPASGLLSQARPSAASSLVSSMASSRASSSRASERSHSQSRSHSHSDREPASRRPTFIIRPRIIGVPVTREPAVPAQTFLSTAISLLLYLAVLIIILAVECPFDEDVVYFFAFVLLAFTGSLFVLVINLTAVRHHSYNCVNTSLSLLYSGSAVLVLFGLVHTAIHGLCKPAGAARGSIFKSGVAANYFMWVMTGVSVLWQLAAYYYYG